MTTSNSEFSSDTALVTGATSGIGRSVALMLGKAGAKTVLTGIGDEVGASVVSEIEEAGGTAAYINGNLSDRDGWKQLLEDAKAPYGAFSILVHCASPPRPESQTLFNVTEDQWDAMMNTNLRSGFFLGRAVAQGMLDASLPGRIVYMTSLHAETPRNLPHYSASKSGQSMLVREMARALAADGIRVNGIAPGAIPGGGFKADVSTLEQRIPAGRTGTPDDVASATLALLSNKQCGYVTGQVLAVDGGLALYNWIDRPS